jgi:hypothetical protein
MVDNFTLQGSYCFLRPELKKNGILAEECISNLIESVVIYDKIYVPDDVLKLNSACKEIVDQFDNVITGKAGTQLADYHHEIVDKEILQRFIPLLQRKDPFMKFNNREAWSIEETGYPWSSSPGYMGKYDRPLQFGERHTYYTWYCIRLAASLHVNYVPNPTRIQLFNDPEFMAKTPLFDFRKKILLEFEEVGRAQNALIFDAFAAPGGIFLEMPLIYNYVTKKNSNIVEETINLRNSKPAEAYREYCRELEDALTKRNDKQFLLNKRAEIRKLANQWSESLNNEKAKKKVNLAMPFIGGPSVDINVPIPNPSALDKRLHYVFIHTLLSAVNF